MAAEIERRTPRYGFLIDSRSDLFCQNIITFFFSFSGAGCIRRLANNFGALFLSGVNSIVVSPGVVYSVIMRRTCWRATMGASNRYFLFFCLFFFYFSADRNQGGSCWLPGQCVEPSRIGFSVGPARPFKAWRRRCFAGPPGARITIPIFIFIGLFFISPGGRWRGD